MGLVRSLFEPREKRLDPGKLRGLLGMGLAQSVAGTTVTPGNALTNTSVLACVRVLTESLASLPLIVYRQRGRNRDRATDVGLYELLHDQPNAELTSFEYRELKFAHTLLWGNGYAEIEWSEAGEVLGLWPLNPVVTEPVRFNGKLYYVTQIGNETISLPAWRVHHLRGLGTDGLRGLSMIRLAMNAIGLGLATEEFGGRFFSNGARPGVVLKHPGVLSDPAYERLKNSWNAEHQGLSNAHRVKILEEGLSMETLGIPPEEAQFLETRKFQLAEVARIYRVPAHMVNDLDHATFSNIEHLSIQFVTHSLLPWMVRDEKAMRRDLLVGNQRKKLLIKYLVNALLRGDTTSRYQAYSIGRQNGWLSTNDIREMEDMNPVEGGDVYLQPLNMAPIGEGGQQPKQSAQRALIGLYEDAMRRLVRREVADIGRQRKQGEALVRWADDFYRELAPVVQEVLGPVVRAHEEALGLAWGQTEPVLGQFARNYAQNGRNWLENAQKTGQFGAQLAQREDELVAAMAGQLWQEIEAL
ncbi:MAG: phage portal protein [Desulfurellales bacterium]|nr:MAG: phage portal protein [Desulfurellales bacterium]